MKIKLKGAYANPASPSMAGGSLGGVAGSGPGQAELALPGETREEAGQQQQQQGAPGDIAVPTHTREQGGTGSNSALLQSRHKPIASTYTPAHPNFQPVEGSSSASASSSQADDDYLNAPLDLPESSGDEYEEEARKPGRPVGAVGTRRRKHFKSDSPRPARRAPRTRGAGANGAGEGDPMLDDDDGDFELDDNDDDADAKFVASSPRKSSNATGTGRKRGRPRLPRDAEGNIIHPPGRKGRSRSEVEDDDEEADFAREDSLLEGDETGMIIDDVDDDEDEDEASIGVPSGQITPGGGQIPSRRAATGNASGLSGTPAEPRRRGGFGVGGVHRSKQVKGFVYDLKDEELDLPLDPAGEQKVDKQGRLKGGREYKCPTFTCATRADPQRLYILAIDAARCAGFRDSLYFFRRNPLIHKLNCSQEEKEALIAQGKLHINLKSRQVTILTARNCFRIFGARFVKSMQTVQFSNEYKPS